MNTLCASKVQSPASILSKLDDGPMRVMVLLPTDLAGKVGISVPPVRYARNGKLIRVYFTEGSIISINLHVSSIVII